MKTWLILAATFGAIVLLPAAETGKPIAKPGSLKTLVNPDCSHCVDEAKRRGAELLPRDRVLAWIRGKYDGGAIPVRFFLNAYPVISDTYGVFVFDPSGGFMRGFAPSLDFRFYGWRNGVMLIQHQDGTVFSALSGRALEGPRKGSVLEPVPTLETDWGYWSSAYPGTVAYHMYDKYVPAEISSAAIEEARATRSSADRRLAASEVVVGVSVGSAAKVYPVRELQKQPVITDTVGGQSLVVLWAPLTGTGTAFAPELEDQSNPPVSVRLRYDPAENQAPFVDDIDSRWRVEGRAVSGPRAGKTLRWLSSVQCRWFAWASEYPETAIYAPAPQAAR